MFFCTPRILFKHFPQDKFPCLFVILFNAYLSFLLLRQLRLFVCYVFSVVSFFCFAIIAPFSCHMLLISTPLGFSIAIFRFHSPVRGIFFFIVLYNYIIFLFLCHFCKAFVRNFHGSLVPLSWFRHRSYRIALPSLCFFLFSRVPRSSRSRHYLSRELQIKFVYCY